MQYRYHGGASHMSADLKRVAHDVRQTVDAMPIGKDAHGRPVNPRLARYSQFPTTKRVWDEVRQSFVELPDVRYEAPNLNPRARHRLARERWANYSELLNRPRGNR